MVKHDVSKRRRRRRRRRGIIRIIFLKPLSSLNNGHREMMMVKKHNGLDEFESQTDLGFNPSFTLT